MKKEKAVGSSVNSTSWYVDQKARDKEFEALTEATLGDEKAIFVAAMSETRDFLTDAVGERIDDLTGKVKISIAESGFNSVWAAWCDMLSSRYSTAIALLRSISETPDFLDAITVRPELAHEWSNGRLKIEGALRAIRDAMRDEGQRQAATEWAQKRNETNKPIQQLAHITAEACISGVPVEFDEQGRPKALVVGGVVDERLARLLAVYLAYESIRLLSSCVFAFQHLEAVANRRDGRPEGWLQRLMLRLTEVFESPAIRLALTKGVS